MDSMHDAAAGRGLSRRRFLLGGAALALAGLGVRIAAHARFDADPFALGVASGDPSADGFVLWTRIAGTDTDATWLPMQDYAVDWEVAEDERFSRIARRGQALASADWAHSVHVEPHGLAPDRWYWYRFHCGGATSPIGRTRTLPAAATPSARLRLALASCQHYEHGHFSAYRHLLADDPDLVVHVGDYIYEGSWGPQLHRHESARGAVTLADYRNRHACYKSDPDLRAAHAACPWLATWDDHEVSNDYAGARSHYGEPAAAFATRRDAAWRAWYEHMPVRAAHRPRPGAMPLYRRVEIGDLATINLLDNRQYRSPPACADRGDMLVDCAERLSPARTLLGERQQHWLEHGLADSRTRWNVIAQQTLIAPFATRDEEGRTRHWADGWDGYPGARARLLDFIASRRVQDVVTLGGDMHAFYATDLKLDFGDERSAVVASEFVGTSISAAGDDHDVRVRDLALNPHVRHYDGRWRGYLRCEIDHARWRTDLRAIDDVADASSGVRTLQTCHVESGRAGIV
jgi:alkaline phosphatase D